MSLIRAFFASLADADGHREPRWKNGRAYPDPLAFSMALMHFGVETGEATELIRQDLARREREAAQHWREAGRRDREAEAYAARQDSVTAAALKVLRQAGWRDPEEDEPPPPPPARESSFMGPWLPPADGVYQRATMDHDPLLDGPVSP